MSVTEQIVGELLNKDDWTGRSTATAGSTPRRPSRRSSRPPARCSASPVADAATVARAAKSAARAQRDWAAVPMAERVAIVSRAGELLERHRAEITTWMVRESGAIPPKVDHGVTASIGQLMEAATLTEDVLERALASPIPGAHLDRATRTDRRDRRDRALELPDRARNAVDRTRRSCSGTPSC